MILFLPREYECYRLGLVCKPQDKPVQPRISDYLCEWRVTRNKYVRINILELLAHVLGQCIWATAGRSSIQLPSCRLNLFKFNKISSPSAFELSRFDLVENIWRTEINRQWIRNDFPTALCTRCSSRSLGFCLSGASAVQDIRWTCNMRSCATVVIVNAKRPVAEIAVACRSCSLLVENRLVARCWVLLLHNYKFPLRVETVAVRPKASSCDHCGRMASRVAAANEPLKSAWTLWTKIIYMETIYRSNSLRHAKKNVFYSWRNQAIVCVQRAIISSGLIASGMVVRDKKMKKCRAVIPI